MVPSEEMRYTKQNIIDFYTKEGKNPKSTQMNVYSRELSRKRFNLVKKFLDKFSCDMFLEVGCAEGMYCAEMSKNSTCVVGLDISKDKLKRAIRRPNIIYTNGDWDVLPFPENSFDIVLATEVFEHALEPAHLVEEIFRVGKLLVATCPLGEKKIKDPLEHGSGHLHVFNEVLFKDLFSGHKITREEIDESGRFMAVEVER